MVNLLGGKGSPCGCACRLTVDDVNAGMTAAGFRTGWRARQLEDRAAELGITTVPDWAGRPTVTVAEAGRIRGEQQRRRDESRAMLDAQSRELHEAKTAREEAERRAKREAWDEAMRQDHAASKPWAR